jgi:hypothetical protein
MNQEITAEYQEKIMKKWASILNASPKRYKNGAPKEPSKYVRWATAQVLENTQQAIEKEKGDSK